MTYKIITLGCKVNAYESESYSLMLEEKGYIKKKVTEFPFYNSIQDEVKEFYIELNVDNNLLTAFERIYTHGNNINPYNLLDTLNSNTDYSYRRYQRTLK